MSDWESEDKKQALQLLVGEYFGDCPEERLDEIRAAKKKRARRLCKKLGCHKESVVLEIGSGMGLTSKHVARRVKQLICSDISTSFLELAKKECADVQNIEFVKIEEEPAQFSFPDESFDMIFSDAVFIHLNLYDIFWYFSEFQRLIKRRGKVLINVMDSSKIETPLFDQMAEFYRQDRNNLKTLIYWNSVEAVIGIASRFGFKLKSKGRMWGLVKPANLDLLFSKK